MKKLTYKIGGYTAVYNPETEEVEQRLSIAEVIVNNPTDEEITSAAEIAYNGEYTIEDDGVEPTTAEKIAELKNQLAATDYKVIKCAECQMLGQEMPYDVAELHAERQAIRDEINKLGQGV